MHGATIKIKITNI